jgi:hypothetical protein
MGTPPNNWQDKIYVMAGDTMEETSCHKWSSFYLCCVSPYSSFLCHGVRAVPVVVASNGIGFLFPQFLDM